MARNRVKRFAWHKQVVIIAAALIKGGPALPYGGVIHREEVFSRLKSEDKDANAAGMNFSG